MRRAFIVLVAALAVLLAYPATMPSAKSPGIADSPTIAIIHPGTGGDIPRSGDDDGGDGDDLAGLKEGTRPTGGGGPLERVLLDPTRSGAKVWWIYFLYHVRIMF